MTDFADLTLGRAADLLRSGALSPVEYVSDCLRSIERFDGRVSSFLHVFADAALAEARVAESDLAAGRWRGPLHGVPVALKDLFDVEGTCTTAHSKVMAGQRARSDAFVVSKLREAGAVVVGKTALHEFATGGPSFDLPWPPARNPWKLSHHPGGSSSGSGAAVAAGFVPAALGTDTAGSVRNPATACGVVGMKPTYGAVSRGGTFPLAFSLDHVGPLTRTVEDNLIVLRAILGRDPDDPASLAHPCPPTRDGLRTGVAGLRIGLIETFQVDAASEIRDAMAQAVRVLSDLGAEIVPMPLSPLDRYSACGRLILQAEAFAVHERWLRERPLDYGMRARVRLLPGAFLGAGDYVRAQQVRTLLVREFREAMDGFDAALAVSSLELPCAIDDEAEIDRTYDKQARTPFNLTGTPALSCPIGFSASGLPIGMQVLGKPFDEAMVYRVAHAYEQATSWSGRRPDLGQPAACSVP